MAGNSPSSFDLEAARKMLFDGYAVRVPHLGAEGRNEYSISKLAGKPVRFDISVLAWWVANYGQTPSDGVKIDFSPILEAQGKLQEFINANR